MATAATLAGALEPAYVYRPRQPEHSVLRQAVVENLDAFLAGCAEAERPVPDFVEKELRAFINCGVVELGAVRVRCPSCGFDRLVPFACKGRGGICPSCSARRMAETAANLVDHVLPEAPYRQMVLTVPVPLRYVMAYNAEVCSDVITAFMRAVARSFKRRAKDILGLASARDLHTGGICFLQRFGSSGANLNPHLHALVLDGVFVEEDNGLRFVALPEPTRGELNAIAWDVCQRVVAKLRERGLWLDGDTDASDVEDPLAAEEPLLAALCNASLTGTLLFGNKPGQRPMRLFAVAQSGGEAQEKEKSKNGYGFDLDGSVRVGTDDRTRLERVLRYMGRPAVTQKHIERRADGQYCLRFKRPWSDGTAAIVLSGMELVARLAALVPPPRMHLVRYFGVFAPRARLREQVVPARPTTPTPPDCPHATTESEKESPRARQRRMTWAQLLKRVFEIDVLECPRCGGRMQQTSVITRPEVIRRMLESMARAQQGP